MIRLRLAGFLYRLADRIAGRHIGSSGVSDTVAPLLAGVIRERLYGAIVRLEQQAAQFTTSDKVNRADE